METDDGAGIAGNAIKNMTGWGFVFDDITDTKTRPIMYCGG
jgi:hypothetical protein